MRPRWGSGRQALSRGTSNPVRVEFAEYTVSVESRALALLRMVRMLHQRVIGSKRASLPLVPSRLRDADFGMQISAVQNRPETHPETPHASHSGLFPATPWDVVYYCKGYIMLVSRSPECGTGGIHANPTRPPSKSRTRDIDFDPYRRARDGCVRFLPWTGVIESTYSVSSDSVLGTDNPVARIHVNLRAYRTNPLSPNDMEDAWDVDIDFPLAGRCRKHRILNPIWISTPITERGMVAYDFYLGQI